MSFDENTQTMSVGSRDWLEASKDMQIQGYLPPAGGVYITIGSLGQSIQFAVTSYQVPVLMDGEHQGARLAERLNEAYQDDELEPKERELLNLAAEQFGRRLSSQE